MPKRKVSVTPYDLRRENAQSVHVSDDAEFAVGRSLGWYGGGFITVTGGVKVSVGSVLRALGVSDATMHQVVREVEDAFEDELYGRSGEEARDA